MIESFVELCRGNLRHISQYADNIWAYKGISAVTMLLRTNLK